MVKKKTNLLDIVIINYKTPDLVIDCLDSFYSDLELDFQVFIVDNHSQDKSLSKIKKAYPEINYIENKQNLGFARANNQAIKSGNSKYVLLLNSDTLVPAESIVELVEYQQSHPQVGISAPRLQFADKDIQANGGSLPDWINLIGWQLLLDQIPLLTHFFQPIHINDREFYLETRQLGWVSGAAMLLRREMIDRIGLLDKKIFMYAEDIEYCWRARKDNWQVITQAVSKPVTHFGQQSGNSHKARLGEAEQLKYVIGKHNPGLAKFTPFILYLGAQLRSFIYKLIGKADESELYRQIGQVVR